MEKLLVIADQLTSLSSRSVVVYFGVSAAHELGEEFERRCCCSTSRFVHA